MAQKHDAGRDNDSGWPFSNSAGWGGVEKESRSFWDRSETMLSVRALHKPQQFEPFS